MEHLKDLYGQPFLQYLNMPIGANETEKFLNAVVAFAIENGADINELAVRKYLKKEDAAYYAEIEELATFLLEFRYGLPGYVHIIHDASYVLGLSKFLLNETGVIPKEQFIVDDTPEKFQQKIADELQHKNQLVEKYLNKSTLSFVISLIALIFSLLEYVS